MKAKASSKLIWSFFVLTCIDIWFQINYTIFFKNEIKAKSSWQEPSAKFSEVFGLNRKELILWLHDLKVAVLGVNVIDPSVDLFIDYQFEHDPFDLLFVEIESASDVLESDALVWF